MGAGWMKGRGQDGLAEEAKENEFAGSGPRRFWLKPEGETQVAFVDDNPIRYYEHNLNIKGSWQNWATCPGEETCPLCAAGDRPSYVAAWVVVDRTVWKDKKGKEHKDEIRLLVAKSKIAVLLAKRSKQLRDSNKNPEGLRNIVFTVARSGALASSVGDDFQIKGRDRALIASIPEKDLPNLEEVLKPDPRQLARFARMISGTGGKGGSGSAGSGGRKGSSEEVLGDDDIPF